jgi:hypothetical protein
VVLALVACVRVPEVALPPDPPWDAGTPDAEVPDAGEIDGGEEGGHLQLSEEPDAGADAGTPPWPTWAQALVDRTDAGEWSEETLDGGGVHLRFGTSRGPVHVFKPLGYSPKGAGVLVYLHGYFSDVDAAFAEHRLAEQFAESEQNALFIVPEVPSGRSDDVWWKDLDELLREVARATHEKLPFGPVVAAGHSGAYRTLASWLDSRKLTEVILIDGLYANDDDFYGWVTNADGGTPDRKLVLVGLETAARSSSFLRRVRELAARRDEFPDSVDQLTAKQRKAQVLYLDATSRFDHMGLLTSGKVLPVLLRVTPFSRVRRR